MDPHRISRVQCRKCGAVLPGPIEICPICYADQSVDPPKRSRYNVFVFWGFFVVLLIVVLVLVSKLEG